MDPIKSKRLKDAKIIISELIMVLAVIVTVVVLAFIVSGYWFNSEFRVERQGMLQVSSTPTGAHITIDKEEQFWPSVTNTSRILSSGEHLVELTKDKYDTWSKTINISEGLLYRLHYPRLFLKERTIEPVMSIDTTTSATISPDGNKMILMNNSSTWAMIELNSETPKQTQLDISGLFFGRGSGEGDKIETSVDEIISINWNRNSSHILFRAKTPNEPEEWVLLDVNNPERSINITREFGTNFDDIKILDGSANTLLAIRDHNLHRIDLSHRSVSSVLVKGVKDFGFHDNEVVFSARVDSLSDENEQYYVGVLKIGDSEIKQIKRLTSPAMVAISKFYDEIYITILADDDVMIYRRNNDDYEEILHQELTMKPTRIKVGHYGDFVLFSNDNSLTTLDMESKVLREWTIDGTGPSWLDEDMLYSIKDSNLIVYDYDGYNRRELSSKVSEQFPVTITDDRWLYYVSDGTLTREWLVEH